MTVATTLNRKTYAGNGSTLDFPTTFQFESEDDLVVILKTNSTGAEVQKFLTTDFTVTGGDGDLGTVHMLVAPASGVTFTVYNDPAILQDLDLVEGDSSPAESKERAYDLLTFICQRLGDRIDRSIRLSEGFATTFDLTLPLLLPANTTLLVNSTGDGFTTGPTADDIENAQQYAADASASASAAASSASAASTSASAASTSASSAATSAASAAAAAAAAVTAALAASPVITTPAVTGGTFAHPGVTDYIDFTEVVAQTAPGAGKTRFWAQSDGTGFWLRRNGGVATRVGSGGGGGGGVIWRIFSNAPNEADDGAGLDLFEFNAQDSQEVWAQLQVPAEYVAGTQIFLKGGKFAAVVTSGNVKFKATAFLVHTGTYVLGANGTGNASTNAQVAVSGTTNKIVEIGDIDLTTTDGKINSVSVAAGDLILVKLIRDTANETSAAAGDARMLRFAMVPKFTA